MAIAVVIKQLITTTISAIGIREWKSLANRRLSLLEFFRRLCRIDHGLFGIVLVTESIQER